MVKSEKTNLYLLSIVGIVAVVGIVILLLQSSQQSVWTDGDIAGEATSSATCTDTDGGLIYTTKGKVYGGTWKTTGKAYTLNTDYCNPKGYIVEYYCSDTTHAFSTTQSCATKVGTGYVCKNGACIDADSDDDGLTDDEEATYGTDAYNVDTDDDGLTDYEEVMTYNTDPNDSDSDDDGLLGLLMSGCIESTEEDIKEGLEGDPEGYLYLTDYEEVTYGTDPNDQDSDDDEFFDGVEIMGGSDPIDASDIPSATISVVCPPDCENGLQDGSETDVDCGGTYCDSCEEGEDCENDSDCISDSCSRDICAAAEEEIPEETE